jgi:hypothetical protein
MAADDQLYGIRDGLPAHQGALHAFVAHCFAVGDHEGVELQWHDARRAQ